jgi:hypothetical protein
MAFGILIDLNLISMNFKFRILRLTLTLKLRNRMSCTNRLLIEIKELQIFFLDKDGNSYCAYSIRFLVYEHMFGIMGHNIPLDKEYKKNSLDLQLLKMFNFY